MISYSIDASVYAYPFKKDIPDQNEIYIYYKTIEDLYEVIIKKQPRNRKFYLFKDIVLLFDYKELNLLERDILILDKMSMKAKIPFTFRDAQKNLRKIFNKLLSTTDLLSKKIMFENWFNIKDVKFKYDKYPPLPELDDKIDNKYLLENIKKNIAKIAYLNEYVYKNNNIHNITIGNNISSQTITVTNWKFKVIMTSGYKIKNAPLSVCINTQNVNVSNLDALVKNNYKFQSGEWKRALNEAKVDFKNRLEFGLDVRANLKEYTKRIDEESKKEYKLSDRQRIADWMKEGPNALYENLKALNDFMTNADLSTTRRNQGERYRYSCKGKCEFLEVCGSNIRYFGVDCVDERWGHKSNSFVIEDRKKMDSKDNKNVYWTHLRPKSFECDDPLWFLTFRIHFRLLKPYTAKKIEIGWIGRHLYLPCRKKDNISDCKRPDCPVNPKSPLHDPKADELTNYLKQW